MKIKPLADNILVEPSEREVKTPSGIVIPDTAKEKPQEGKVMAVGPGKYEDGKLVKPEVKKGDRILYRRYGGNEIRIEGKDYLMVSSDDVLAIIGS
jgi:chaperonin GroES